MGLSWRSAAERTIRMVSSSSVRQRDRLGRTKRKGWDVVVGRRRGGILSTGDDDDDACESRPGERRLAGWVSASAAASPASARQRRTHADGRRRIGRRMPSAQAAL